MSASEIARLRQQIALEYESAKQGLEGFAAMAAHEFITARQERIEACFTELTQYMSPEEAIVIVLEAENGIQPSSSGTTS